jgi:CheY-like chemotaxis protein
MKVLVVDDEPSNRRLLVRMLSFLQVTQISEANSGNAALEMAATQQFDAVLMDISMPEMDGVEACKQMRRLPGYLTVLVIACTAHASKADSSDFLRSGFSSVLVKPFLLEELSEVLGSDLAAGC